jgi:hypothetical protein
MKDDSKTLILFLAFPLVILLCETLGLSVGRSSVEQYQVETHGTIVDGKAFFTEYKAAGRSAGAYYVRYVFNYNGVRYKGEWHTTEAWVRSNRLPTMVRVQFLPDNPANNWPPDVGVHRSLPLKLLFVFLCLCAVAYLAPKVISAWLRSGMPRSGLGIWLTVLSWPMMAAAAFDVVPLLFVLLSMGCVMVAAGFSIRDPLQKLVNAEGV